MQSICKKCKGLTFLELIVTLGILGVIISVSLPAFTSYREKVRLKSSAEELLNVIYWVKGQAIKRNQDYMICFDTTNNSYSVYSEDGPDNTWDCGNDDQLFRVYTLPNGISFDHGSANKDATTTGDSFTGDKADNVSYANNRLPIYSRGTSNAGFVYLGNKSRSYAVGTLATGIVRVRLWKGSAWE